MEVLFNWMLGLVDTFLQFGSWLSQPLPLINLTPLALIGFTGITLVIGFLIARLVVGG